MSEKIDQIVEDLKTLTLLEASELVTKIEETFGVDASAAAGGGMMMAAAAPAEEVEEPAEEPTVDNDEDAKEWSEETRAYLKTLIKIT